MEISVKQSGGFAGISQDLGTVDTEHLNSAKAQQIASALSNVDFFALPATVPGEIGADQFRYEIKVTDGDRQHTVTFYDDGSNSDLHKLVQMVTQL